MATSKEIKSDIELGELRNESKKPGDFVYTGVSNPLIDPQHVEVKYEEKKDKQFVDNKGLNFHVTVFKLWKFLLSLVNI